MTQTTGTEIGPQTRVGHQHSHASDNLRTVFLINFGFSLFEIIGGLLTNSVAIISDAIHDLGDSVALGFGWWMNTLSEREPTQRYSYGYHRFSLLAAFVNAMVLIVGTALIMIEATPRLLRPEPVHVPGMIGFAVIGVTVNIVAALRLRGGKTMNERVLTWHLWEDVLGWMAVLAAAIFMLFREVPILDPLLCICISAFILYGVFRNLRKTIGIFFQHTPADVDLDAIEERILASPAIMSLHHLHVWSLDGARNVLTAHVVISDRADRAVYHRAKEAVRTSAEENGIEHITVEVEYEDEECQMKYR